MRVCTVGALKGVRASSNADRRLLPSPRGKNHREVRSSQATRAQRIGPIHEREGEEEGVTGQRWGRERVGERRGDGGEELLVNPRAFPGSLKACFQFWSSFSPRLVQNSPFLIKVLHCFSPHYKSSVRFSFNPHLVQV